MVTIFLNNTPIECIYCVIDDIKIKILIDETQYYKILRFGNPYYHLSIDNKTTLTYIKSMCKKAGHIELEFYHGGFINKNNKVSFSEFKKKENEIYEIKFNI